MARTRILLLTVLSLLGACAHSGPEPITPLRGTRSASFSHPYTLNPGEERSVDFTVLEHDSLSMEGLESHVLKLEVLENSGKRSITLRYALPRNERIALEPGDTGQLVLALGFPEETGKRSFTSVLIAKGGEWTFGLLEQEKIPESLLEGPLRIIGSGDTVYRESGRVQGLCEAVRAERELLFSWEGRRYRIAPGESITVAHAKGKAPKFTLVEQSEVLQAQCELDPTERSSIYFLAP